MRIVFFGKGSRGDIQPVAVLAIAIKNRFPQTDIDVAYDFRAPSDLRKVLDSNGIGAHPLPSPQDVLNKDVSSLLVLTDEEKLQLLKAELIASLPLVENANAVVFNLFACEVWFLASHRRIPCICVSTFFPSRPPVSGFEKKLKKSYSALYQKLNESLPGLVSYSDVDHWMWRLFLDDIGQAVESIGIPHIPFLDVNECVFEPLPSPTKLIYGISPMLLEIQPYWPKSVLLTGYWSLNFICQQDPSKEVEALMQSLQGPILYVGFGSMEDVYTIEWQTVMRVLTKAASVLKMEILLHSRHAVASDLQNHPRLHLLSQPVPHQWLFPQCSVIMCHGGCGTLHLALSFARPVIVCPFGFDQFFWADRVEWLGVGRRCASMIDALSVDDLVSAVQSVLSPDVQTSVDRLAQELQAEQGLLKTVELLVNEFKL